MKTADENTNVLCSWSGGKDSCFALMTAFQQSYSPRVLLNVLNEKGKISRSHGIPSSILEAQAASANLPIHLISSSWNDYEKKFTDALRFLKEKYDLRSAVFGDIDLQPHRDWEEKVCLNAGLRAILPLWKEDRRSLVMKMLEQNIKTMIVSCNDLMGKDYIGRLIDAELISELEQIGVDPCGENGEFHTLVLNAPIFKFPIAATIKAVVQHEQYWFAEME